MSLGEVYFLIFMCGSFGALAVGLAAATIRYQHWRKQTVSEVNPVRGRTTQRSR